MARRIRPALPRPGYIILFIVFYLVSVYPIVGLKYMPYTDLPDHLVAGLALRDIFLGGPLRENFSLSGFFPNMLSWLVIALLSIFFDILTSAKIVMLLYFLITPLSVYYFLGDDRKDLSLLSFLFLNNQALNMGWFNFLLSIPLFFLALGAFRKDSKVFYISSLLLFLSHLVTYVLFLPILFIHRLLGRGPGGGRKIVYSLFLLACFVFFTYLASPAAPTRAQKGFFALKPLAETLVEGVALNVSQSMVYAFQLFRVDYFSLLGAVIIVLMYARQLFLSHDYDSRIVCSVSLILLFILILPYEVDLGGTLWKSFTGRFLPLAFILNLTDLHLGRKTEKALILLFLLLVVASSASIAPHYAEADRRLAEEYAPVVSALPKGGCLYVMDVTQYLNGSLWNSKRTYGTNPYVIFLQSSYLAKGGRSSFMGSGTQSAYWPVRYLHEQHHPGCELNKSEVCDLCDGLGQQCYDKDSGRRLYGVAREGDGVVCVSCSRPMEVRCYINESFGFIITDSCIPCSRRDVECFLRNEAIKEGFDYLAVSTNSDDINRYRLNESIYISTDSVIVYMV